MSLGRPTTDADEAVGPGAVRPIRRGGEFGFLVGYGLLICGIAFSTLDATAITTTSIDRSNGAIWTSVYVATLIFSTAISVPSAPKLAGRFGPRRVYSVSAALSSAAWLVTALLVLAGVRPVPVLMFGAVVIGLLWGVFSGLSPLFTKAYCSGTNMAGSMARLSVATGLFYGLGSVGAGFMLNVVDPGWGLLIRALLGVPFSIFIFIRPPALAPPAPEIRDRALATLRARLRDNRELRRVVILGCGVAVFAAPLALLIVPITAALRQTPLIPGAGILAAAMSVGEVMAPVVVSKLGMGRPQLRAAALAALGAAVFLALYGVTSIIADHRSELVAWAVVGVGFGAMRFGSKALATGAAADSDTDENTGESVAALVFVSCLAAPFGVLIWGVLINHVSVGAAIAVGVIGMVLFGALAARRGSTSGDRPMGSEEPPVPSGVEA